MPFVVQVLWASVVLASLATGVASAAAPASHSDGRSTYVAPQAVAGVLVDGIADDAAWESAAWRDIKFRWLGPEYTAEDFAGRFKVVWTPERIYILAEIT